jgi:hypothetical protein
MSSTKNVEEIVSIFMDDIEKFFSGKFQNNINKALVDGLIDGSDVANIVFNIASLFTVNLILGIAKSSGIDIKVVIADFEKTFEKHKVDAISLVNEKDITYTVYH